MRERERQGEREDHCEGEKNQTDGERERNTCTCNDKNCYGENERGVGCRHTKGETNERDKDL